MIISEGDRSHRLDYKIDWKKLAQNFFVLEKKTWLSKALAEYPNMEVTSSLIARCKVTYFPDNLNKTEKIWYRYVKNFPDFPFNFDKKMRKLFFENQNLIIKSTDLSKDAPRTHKKGSAAAIKPSEGVSGSSSVKLQSSAGRPLKIRRVKTLYSETLIVDDINKDLATKSNTALSAGVGRHTPSGHTFGGANPALTSGGRATNLYLMEKLLDLPMVAKLTQNRISVELSHLYPKKVMGIPLTMIEYIKLRNENLITSDSEYNFNYKEKDCDNLPAERSVPAAKLNSGLTSEIAADSANTEDAGRVRTQAPSPKPQDLKKEFRFDVTTNYELYLNNTN